jgi:lipopolysaccharide export system permease protein
MAIGNILMHYLVKEFLTKLLLFCLVLFGVVYLFDTIELIRRASGDSGIGLGGILKLALYKLPEVGQEILPFIVLFASMATLWSLSQRKELESIRAAGISVWQFTLPLTLVAFVFGLIYLTVLHPLSAAAMAKYGNLEQFYFKKGQSTISVIDDGIWLRQEDETGNFILKADTLDAAQWVMKDVTLFFYDSEQTHTQRIDATQATLTPNEWIFENARLYKSGEKNITLPELRLSTSLTQESIAESFSNPQTISFWQLPGFISALSNTGLDTTEMRIYYQTLLVKPLLFLSMVFLAAAISLKTARHTKLLPVVVSGLGIGFAVFFFSGFLRALGAGHEIPIPMAVWSPPIIVLLGAIATLMSLEDG